METEEHFPQLLTDILACPEDRTVKKEDEVLKIIKAYEEMETKEMETASTSANKPATRKRKKAEGDDSGPICSQQKRIKCPECSRYTAETEEIMSRHIRKVHRGEDPFQCYMCEYTTYNNVRFEEHVRKHQGIKPFRCVECEYSSASRKNLKKHELKHKPDYPLKCATCGFIGQHRSALRAHMRTGTHEGNSNAKCIKKSNTKRIGKGLKNIQPNETYTTSSNYSCDICSAKYETDGALKHHIKCKRKCPECETSLCSKKLLTAHINLHHSDIEKYRSRKEQFTCKICGWKSFHLAKVLLHLIHHPTQVVDENVFDISILRKYHIME